MDGKNIGSEERECRDMLDVPLPAKKKCQSDHKHTKMFTYIFTVITNRIDKSGKMHKLSC